MRPTAPAAPAAVGGTLASAGVGAVHEANPRRDMLPVAVVIVAFDSGTALRRTVEAALAERPAELVVLDNASRDGSTAFLGNGSLACRDTELVWVRLEDNVGFAAGCNRGAAHTTSPYLLWLNDDAVLRPGYLATLCAALDARLDAASAVGKIVYHRNGHQYVDSAGLTLVRHALRPQDRGQDELDRGQYDAPHDVFGPTGAAALYRRAAFAAANGFDASLFAYYEDVDLAWRLGRAGWRHLYVPSAVADHRRRGPIGRPVGVEARAFYNRYRVWARNEPLRRFACYAPVALAWEGARLARLGWRRPRFLAHLAYAAVAAVRGPFAGARRPCRTEAS